MSEMCRSIAPGHIAMCVPPPPKGEVYRTPWCHLPAGHAGPHACGEWRWEGEASDEELKQRCKDRLAGIGRTVDMTHPDYCPTCDGACVAVPRHTED